MNGQTQGSIIGGFVAVIVLYIVNTYALPTPLPDPVAQAVTALITIVGGMLIPVQANPAKAMFKTVFRKK